MCGVGTQTAADLLITTGTNPHRISTETSFAALCGTSPVDASSGRHQRHRLNRGGDRQANAALYRIVIVRLRYHPPTRSYMQRRLQQGLTKPEIIRCLKRYVARDIYHILTHPQPAP
jgi:transposase